MAADSAQTHRATLPNRQALVDNIIELFRSAGKINAQNLPNTNPTPRDRDTAERVRCVKQLFDRDAESLAKEAYCFMPGDHNAADPDRPSLKEFQQQWAREWGKSGKGNGSFPEVRRRNALEPFSKCILRCMCSSCRHGKAIELECETFDFGDSYTILIHQFRWEEQTWAVILGTRDDPEEYRIWGKIDATTKQTSYHDTILLKEVSWAKLPKRSGRRVVDGGDDGDFLPETEPHKKRKNASTAVNSSKRHQTLNSTPGKKASAWVGIEGSTKSRTYTPVSDDEEDLTLLQLINSRRKAVASPIGDGRSATTAVPARASPSPHPNPDVQQPQPLDLQKLFRKTKAHVYSQADSNGQPVIVSIVGLAGYMQSLKAAADASNATSFEMIRETINEELEEIGVPALPGV